MLLRNVFLLLLLLVAAAGPTRADESYQLWLKYGRIADIVARQQYLHSAQFTAGAGTSLMLQSASGELQCGLGGLLGQAVSVVAAAGSRTSGIVLRVDKQASANKQPLKAEGYRIFSEKSNLRITGDTNQAVPYGAFAPLLPPTHPGLGQILSQPLAAQVITAHSPRTYSDCGHCNLR